MQCFSVLLHFPSAPALASSRVLKGVAGGFGGGAKPTLERTPATAGMSGGQPGGWSVGRSGGAEVRSGVRVLGLGSRGWGSRGEAKEWEEEEVMEVVEVEVEVEVEMEVEVKVELELELEMEV